MVKSMKECGKMIKNKGKENMWISLEKFLMECGKMTDLLVGQFRMKLKKIKSMTFKKYMVQKRMIVYHKWAIINHKLVIYLIKKN